MQALSSIFSKPPPLSFLENRRNVFDITSMCTYQESKESTMRSWDDVRKQIKAARNERGYTVEQLAQLCGVQRGTISKIENGIRYPSVALFLNICEVLAFDLRLYDEADSPWKRVIMTFSAFRGKHWYSELLQNILNECSVHGIDVIVKVPRRDYNPGDQAKMFENILNHRHRYTAGIVVPVKPDDTKHEILQFTKSFAKPVLFLDVQPFDSEADYPPDTAYLGYDNEAGGVQAADAMCQFLQRARIEKPRILIIGATAQTGRQTGFESHLKRLIPNAEVITHDDGEFARAEAKRIAQNYLESSTGHPWPFEGVYCTNDEMALGVVEVLLTLPEEQRHSVIVVGYDGIEEARLVIDSGNTPLRNTVVQETEILAEETIQLLLRFLGKREAIKIINKLSPRLYKYVRTSSSL